MFKGKKLSILGDSISTYRGVSNDACANATTRYNPYFYCDPFPLERTYWMRLIDRLEMELCVNNSWSGGNLSGIDDENSGVRRVHDLSRDDGESPDYIVLFMGLNDLGRNVPVATFASDYALTLSIIKQKYPNARVCCVNLPDRHVYFRDRAVAFNASIEKAVAEAGDGFFIADLFNSKLNNDVYYDNTVDGLHPDEDGARMISEVVIAAFESLK